MSYAIKYKVDCFDEFVIENFNMVNTNVYVITEQDFNEMKNNGTIHSFCVLLEYYYHKHDYERIFKNIDAMTYRNFTTILKQICSTNKIFNEIVKRRYNIRGKSYYLKEFKVKLNNNVNTPINKEENANIILSSMSSNIAENSVVKRPNN